MTRVKPLTVDDLPRFRDTFDSMQKLIGFVPNSFFSLGHRPEILDAFRALAQTVFSGTVDVGFKSLLAIMSSYGSGCRYCQAHQAGASLMRGMPEEKLEALAEFETSPLYTDGERAGLRMAFAAGQQPNAVTDEHFVELHRFYDDGEIVEMVAVVAMFGFLNRWNDTLATELEDEPFEKAAAHLHGLAWEPGRHRR